MSLEQAATTTCDYHTAIAKPYCGHKHEVDCDCQNKRIELERKWQMQKNEQRMTEEKARKEKEEIERLERYKKLSPVPKWLVDHFGWEY